MNKNEDFRKILGEISHFQNNNKRHYRNSISPFKNLKKSPNLIILKSNKIKMDNSNIENNLDSSRNDPFEIEKLEEKISSFITFKNKFEFKYFYIDMREKLSPLKISLYNFKYFFNKKI